MSARLKASAATAVAVCGILTVCLLVMSMLPKESTFQIDPLRETVTDGHIIYEDFSSAALPEGWDKTHPYVFLNLGEETLGADTTLYDSHITVQQGAGLTISDLDSEHIITLPDLGTENFVYSMEVSFKEFGGSVGLVLDLPQNYLSAGKASFFLITAQPRGEGYVPTFSVFSRTKGDGNFSGTDKNRRDIEVAELLPDCVQVNNLFTGEGIIPQNVTLTLQAYHYKNMSYFYCNGVFVSALPDTQDGRATRVGIFSNTCDKAVEISRVVADSIMLATDKTDELYTLDKALDVNFSKDNTLPFDWGVLGDCRAEPVTLGDSKALALTSLGGEGLLVLPALDTDSYSFTAKLKLSGEGYVGLAANLYSGETPLSGANLMLVASGGEKDILHYNNTLARADQRRIYSQKELLGKTFKAGDTLTLRAYLVGGNCYFYLNGGFISCIPVGSPAERGLCGIYVSGGATAELISLKAYRLAEKGVTSGIIVGQSDLICENDGVGLTFTGSLKPDNSIYLSKGQQQGFSYGVAIYPAGSDTPVPMTELTKKPDRAKGTWLSRDDNAIFFTARFDSVTKKYLSGKVNVCGYIAVEKEGKTQYFYGEPTLISLTNMANAIYPTADPELQLKLDGIFGQSEGYIGGVATQNEEEMISE